MKGGTLEKPPPLLLPHKDHARSLQGRAMSRSIAKYDNFSGILKKVSEMKLNMDTDDTTTTESENSSVRTRSSRSSTFPSEDRPGSPFEDESSASDVTASDHCSPYEELPSSASRYSCSTLSSPTDTSNFLHSFRDGSASECSRVYSNTGALRNSRSSQYEPDGVVLQRQRSRPSSLYSNTDCVRPRTSTSSLYSNGEHRASLYSNCEPDYTNTEFANAPYDNAPVTASTDVNENNTSPERRDITDTEIRKIEVFFRGLRTEICVSTSLANMYVSRSGQEGSWTFKHTGIPLVVLESGDTKSRSKRRIQIILAERGTCFPLWKDVIDNLSSYQNAGQAFHTMHYSPDHQQVIGFSYDCPEQADRILSCINKLTADPQNINICVPGARKKKWKTKEKKKLAPLPTKKQISAPCLFEHVSSVAAKDQPIYMSLKTLLDRDKKKTENIA